MDLSHLLGGATKGLEYIAKTIKARVAAEKAGNTQEAGDLDAVEVQWAGEVVHLIANPWNVLGDPFATSRHMAQAAFTKYGIK